MCPPLFTARISIEKVPGKGEDAPPLVRHFEYPAGVVGAIGVGDGLGGAGSTLMATNDGPRSAAYLASRQVLSTVGTQIDAHFGPSGWLFPAGSALDSVQADHALDRFLTYLDSAIRWDLEQLGEHSPSASGNLRSKLIRPLPTTLALGVFRVAEEGVVLDALWAGDSRIYVLSPQWGLQQLTKDDLKSGGDAMSNLLEDSPMSNILSGDGRFQLNHRRIRLPHGPFLFLAASDGCFGYLPSPAHFELLLLRALLDNTVQGAWEDKVRAAIEAVTGDDATLAVAGVGWPNPGAAGNRLFQRFHALQQEVGAMENLHQETIELRAQLALAEARFLEARQDLWSRYRPVYEHLLGEPVRTLPPARRDSAPEESGEKGGRP
ncbi:hypothetical protein ACFO3J_21000 [Streptomyces polygonati]|uniref:Serine/threonine protein phosphatase PrpC n=1 Tax=Streptomyces polygonati TaxID=1617087 RepID=A0ABV8HT21_9ACTN